MQLEIKGRPPSLNAMYSGMHWSKRKRIVDEWHGLIWAAAVDAKLPKPLQTPVVITATQYCKGVVMDCSNAVMLVKFAEDALVEHGYLPDDSPAYVSEVRLRSVKGKEDKCLIEIT